MLIRWNVNPIQFFYLLPSAVHTYVHTYNGLLFKLKSYMYAEFM